MPPILDQIQLPNFLNSAAAQVQAAGGRPYRQVLGLGRGVRDALPMIYGSGLANALQATPYFAQSNLDLLTNYLPQLAAAESEANRIGQAGQAASDVDVLRQFGPDIVGGIKGLDIFADPEYYATRQDLGGQYSNLLAGLDPNKLSGAEEAQLERALNRSNVGRGTANTGSQIETLRNAMTFGDRLQQKQNQVSNILSQVSAALPTLKTNTVNYGQVTGKGGAGAGQSFLPSSTDVAQNAFGLSSNLLGQASNITTNERNISASRIPTWQQVVGSLPDYS